MRISVSNLLNINLIITIRAVTFSSAWKHLSNKLWNHQACFLLRSLPHSTHLLPAVIVPWQINSFFCRALGYYTISHCYSGPLPGCSWTGRIMVVVLHENFGNTKKKQRSTLVLTQIADTRQCWKQRDEMDINGWRQRRPQPFWLLFLPWNVK